MAHGNGNGLKRWTAIAGIVGVLAGVLVTVFVQGESRGAVTSHVKTCKVKWSTQDTTNRAVAEQLAAIRTDISWLRSWAEQKQEPTQQGDGL